MQECVGKVKAQGGDEAIKEQRDSNSLQITVWRGGRG